MQIFTSKGELRLEVENFGIMIHCWMLLLFLYRVLPTASYVTTNRLNNTENSVTLSSTHDTEHPQKEICNTTVAVRFQANSILLPKTKAGNPIYCWWLLEAAHVDHKIGISSHSTAFDVGPSDYFVLQAHDGPNTTSRVLANIQRVKSDKFFKDVTWFFQRTMVSSTNHLFIEYKSNGNNALQMEILHYTCGGSFSSEMDVSSPIFSNEYARQPYVECLWTLIKPKDAIYGLLKLRYVNISECGSLAISTSGGLKYIVYDDNLRTNESNVTTMSDVDHFPTMVSDEPMKKHIVAKSASKENFSEDLKRDETGLLICKKSVKIVAFDGENATLSYRIDNAPYDIGFAAQYQPVRVHKPRKKPFPKPWYINYFGLVVCTPIGIMIGTAIILFQSKKSKPGKKLDLLLLNRPHSSDIPLEKFRYSQGKAEVCKPETKRNEQICNDVVDRVTVISEYENRSFNSLPSTPLQSKKDSGKAKMYSSSDTLVKYGRLVKTFVKEESPSINNDLKSPASYIRRLSRSTGNLANYASISSKHSHYLPIGTKRQVLHHKHKRKVLLTDGTKTL